MSTTNGAAPDTAPRTITLGGNEIRLERPSGRKSSRALAILRALSRATPQLQREWARFRTEYEAANYVELDRAQAMLQYGPQPLRDNDGRPILEADEVINDAGERVPNPRAGQPIMLRSALEAMTEEAWEKSGQKLRLPKSPSFEEQVAAILDTALEVAEDHVYQLLALFTMSNAEVKAAWRGEGFADALRDRANDLLDDCYGDELLELAVVAGELVDSTFVRKARILGDRLGNLGRLFGLEIPNRPTTPTDEPQTTMSTDGPSASTLTSSTASPEEATEAGTSSSSSPGTSPSSSPPDSTPTETAQEATSPPPDPTTTPPVPASNA